MAVSAPPRTRVEVRPIGATDVVAVSEFLHAHLNERVPVAAWARALDVPWPVERPNAGFMLLDDGDVVGAHLAYYSERTISGRRERFCNLGAWCVLPEFRFHALRLLKALLAQDGYHFTDLSPSGSVVGAERPPGLSLPRHDDRDRPDPPVAVATGAGHDLSRRAVDRADARRRRARALPRPRRDGGGAPPRADPRR